LAYRFFGGLTGLYPSGVEATVEEDVEFVEGGLPARPSRPARSGDPPGDDRP
jgi:hypothetical protein